MKKKADYSGLTEKETELQKLMFENKSALRQSKRKKYFKEKNIIRNQK